jgi:hypothetical protein
MKTSDEAVDAAAKELTDLNGYGWLRATPEVYRKQATLMLEAAAPHLMAAAWDAAMEAAYSIAWDHSPHAANAIAEAGNPYRSAGARE